MTKKKGYPLFAVSGNHEYLRIREVARIINKNREQGWDIDYIDGSNLSDLVTALSSNSFFDTGGKTLAVITKPEKADLILLREHYDSGEAEDVVALLHYEGNPKGNTKFGKFLKDIGKNHLHYPMPKNWELDAKAAEFCVAEAALRGKKIPLELASAMVSRIGNNFGFLSFEILKISMLAEIEGASEISAVHVKGAMASIAEMDVVPIVDAVAMKNSKNIIKSMDRLKKNAKYDPTMVVCSYLANSASRWMSVADLRDKNTHLDEAARLLGLKPWYYKNKVLPQATRWSKTDAIKLLQILADVKRSIFSGLINPWVILSSRILELCR